MKRAQLWVAREGRSPLQAVAEVEEYNSRSMAGGEVSGEGRRDGTTFLQRGTMAGG